MKRSNDLMKEIPLPDISLEKPRFVATIRYQIPKRILLHGRHKSSPKFETLYGLMYWLNKQPYNLDYIIYNTNKKEPLKAGRKKIGETITYE